MNKYEAMLIIRPDLSEDDKKALYNQIGDTVAKNNGTPTQAGVWTERRKFYFTIKKYQEGSYYLMNFAAEPDSIARIKQAYKLNENILRVLILRQK